VTLANDVEIVVRGLESMLAGADSLQVGQVLIGDTPVQSTDVLLIDTFGGTADLLPRMRTAIENPAVKAVVLYSFNVTEPLVDWARAVGLSGVVSKSVHGSVLIDLIRRAGAGEFVRNLGVQHCGLDDSAPLVEDLSFREAEVLALMAAGRTNSEIAETLYLSVETVKTYVSRLFAKIDVRNRTEAALWAARVGLGRLDDQKVLETTGGGEILHAGA